MLLTDYIDEHHKGNRAEFARAQGVLPQMVNKWLSGGWVVIDGMLAKPNIYQTVVFNGRVYDVKKDIKK